MAWVETSTIQSGRWYIGGPLLVSELWHLIRRAPDIRSLHFLQVISVKHQGHGNEDGATKFQHLLAMRLFVLEQIKTMPSP